jgi:Flp pilus assembly protein TadD/O-antigen ligase
VIRTDSKVTAWLIGIALVAVPLVYLPDVLPPLLGIRLIPVALPAVFDFVLLPKLLFLQGLLVAALAVSSLNPWQSTIRSTGRGPLTLPILVYLLLSVVSVFWAPNPIEGTWQASVLLTMVALFAVVSLRVPAERLPGLMGLGAATGALVSCIGIAQYFGWAYADIPTVGNPSATFGYRNFAASYLVATIPIALALSLAARSAARATGWTCAFALMSLFLIYTRTRGAWLGLGCALVGAGCLVWCLRPGIRPLPKGRRSWILAAGVVVALVGGGFRDQMEHEGKFGFDERKTDAVTTLKKTFSPGDSRGRLTVWGHTLEMVLDSPVLGVGLGGWQYIYPAYDRGDWITDNAAPQRPHNDILWILSETGLAGLAAYLWIFVTAGALVWRLLRRAPQSPRALHALGVATGLAALVGHSLLSFPRERVGPSMMMWFGLAAVAVLCGGQGLPSNRRRPKARLMAFVGALALSLALTLTIRRMHFDEHYLLALKAWRTQDWHTVRKQAQEALSWGPLNHRAILLSGVALQQLGQHEEAAAAFGRSLRYHPNEGHGVLASIYAAQGKYDLAERHYRLERQLYPASLKAGLDLADALRHLGRHEEAAESYRELLTTHPDTPEALTGIGACQQAAGNREAALDAFRRARRLLPEDARLCNNVGAVLAELDRLGEAEAAYREAIRLDPGYTRVYHNLGDLYSAMKEDSLAAEAYRHFLQEWKGNPRFLDIARRKLQLLQPKEPN